VHLSLYKQAPLCYNVDRKRGDGIVSKEIVILIYCAICCVLLGQNEASGNIGSRSYSIWYETHFLVEKKGICKLIYFKPKHFERYTLYEVIAFFSSYISIPVFGAFGVLFSVGLIDSNVIFFVAGVTVIFSLLSQLIIVTINDIGSHRDKKKRFYLETGEREGVLNVPEIPLSSENKLMSKVMQLAISSRNNPYFTKYNLWDSYHTRIKEAGKDPCKRNRVNLDYIEYFKNMNHLVVIKENKSGSLQLKIKK
jgi:hypothetical protein